VEVPLPWERLLWSSRAVWPPGAWYALTDFRLIHVNGRRSAEIAIHDIGEIRCSRSGIDHLLGTSTVEVRARDTRRPALVLRHVRRGAPRWRCSSWPPATRTRPLIRTAPRRVVVEPPVPAAARRSAIAAVMIAGGVVLASLDARPHHQLFIR
jgi:hypothetical protein